MKIYTTLSSPYGRKVLLALTRSSIASQIERVEPDIMNEEDPLLAYNPLGKMPCLVLPDGRAIFDSPVILRFLDEQCGARIIPVDPVRRIDAITTEALADGIIDAGLAIVVDDMFHPEDHRSPVIQHRQRAKIARALTFMRDRPPPLDPLDVGGITLASALAYLDRRKQVDWRSQFPALVTWLDDFLRTVPEAEAILA